MGRTILFLLLLMTNLIWAQQPKLMLPIGHNKNVYKILFSPDSKRVITISEDETARIWNTETGILLSVINIPIQYGGWSIAFSSDNKRFLTWNTADVKVWDNNGYFQYALKKDTVIYGAAFFSTDGNKIITIAQNQTKLWDATTGNFVADWGGTTGWSSTYKDAGAVSPDGKKYANLWDDGVLKIWDIKTGNLISETESDSKVSEIVSFSSNSKYVVTDEAMIYEVATGESVKSIQPTDEIDHNTDYKSLTYSYISFSPSGKYISACRSLDDSLARIWDFETGEKIFEVNGVDIDSVSFDPEEKRIFIFSSNEVSVWDISSGRKLFKITVPLEFTSTELSPDKKRLITSARRDDTLRLWNMESGKLIESMFDIDQSITVSGFNSDGHKIITARADGSVMIWNGFTGKPLVPLGKKMNGIYGKSFSPDYKQMITISGSPFASVFDIYSNKTLHKLPHYSWVWFTQYSNDGKKILTVDLEKNIAVWDADSGKLLIELQIKADIQSISFSNDGKKIILAIASSIAIVDASNGNIEKSYIIKPSVSNKPYFSSGNQHFVNLSFIQIPGPQVQKQILSLWDVKTGKVLFTRSGGKKNLGITSAKFSPDGKRLAIADEDKIEVVDVPTGKTIFSKKFEKWITNIEYSPDGNKLLTTSFYEKTPEVWDANTGKSLLQLIGHTEYAFSASFSKDGSKIITVSRDNTIKAWDANNGKIICDMKWDGEEAKTVEFSDNNTKVVCLSENHSMSFWDLQNCKKSFDLYSLDTDNIFYRIPQGSYMCSPAAAKLLYYVTGDLKVITFEQLDVKYNRPDKVLEVIGSTDTALMKSYRKAWEKRVKKLGIDTTAFRDGYSVPEADFTNRDAIEYEQKAGTLRLIIKGNDSTYKLDRFNVWVNETPDYGQRGISIRNRNKNDFDTTITIKLSQGENRIETSITNVNGTESYRMPLTVNYTPVIKQKESTHFIGIGIDQFADNKYNLQYSAKDIRDLSVRLKEKYGNDIVIDTLFNENVTVNNVKTLKQKLQQTNENDKVIVAYSGHGMLSKEYDYYLSTYSVNFDKPEQNGLPYDELENLLDSIPARKKLMLIDACHSGEVDKEDLVTLNASSDSLIKGLKPVGYKQDGHLGLKNSFELMQSLFVNVGKSTGATIISAAAGTQFALERNDLKNGVFTYSILEAMKTNTTMKISELKSIVGKRVEELTNGLQKPTSRNETIAVDWNIW